MPQTKSKINLIPIPKVRRAMFSKGGDWVVLAWIGAMHVGAIAAFWTFSWPAFWVMMGLYFLTGCVGITLGYHRYFTHRSFQTPKPVQYFLAVMGTLAGEAGPIAWVAAHRYHHTYSDTDQDPHSPLKGFIWAHLTWLFGREKFLAEFESYKRYTPDMANDKFLVWLDQYHIVPSLILAGLLYAWGGWSFVVWGLFVRSVVVYHVTWFVNSASHMWGYRTFKTTDMSRNNWWVALLAFGEGWHNNHHAYQRSARHGMAWWELDVTYLMIRLLHTVGLASKIHLPVPGASGLGTTFPMSETGRKPVYTPEIAPTEITA
jgi:fatty-acid desaturase